jgi:hypothetical protein
MWSRKMRVLTEQKNTLATMGELLYVMENFNRQVVVLADEYLQKSPPSVAATGDLATGLFRTIAEFNCRAITLVEKYLREKQQELERAEAT